MIQDAEEYAAEDRQRRERVEKRNRAEAEVLKAERQLREVALTYGMQFAAGQRRRIESLVQELRESMKRDDDRAVDRAQGDLQDALYELNREVRLEAAEDEDDFFGSIRRTFSGEGDSLFGEGLRDRDRDDNIRYRDRDDDRRYSGDAGRERYSRDSGSSYRRPSRTVQPNDDWDDDDDDDWL
jgi:molecular chaperone DnaK